MYVNVAKRELKYLFHGLVQKLSTNCKHENQESWILFLVATSYLKTVSHCILLKVSERQNVLGHYSVTFIYSYSVYLNAKYYDCLAGLKTSSSPWLA